MVHRGRVCGAAAGWQQVEAVTALPGQELEEAPCQCAGWGISLKSSK